MFYQCDQAGAVDGWYVDVEGKVHPCNHQGLAYKNKKYGGAFDNKAPLAVNLLLHAMPVLTTHKNAPGVPYLHGY